MADERWDEFQAWVERVIGHPVTDPTHLRASITHRSYVNENVGVSDDDNERLEFLGDAVLSLVVSEALMNRYPEETEGMLSKYRSSIVNERSLARAARTMELGQFLRLGKGEEITKGREKDSILANAFEAIVAALYLNGGVKDSKAFVLHHFAETIDRAEEDVERHDFKTTLQEFTQRVLGTTPVYRVISQGGPDHEKTFESAVEVAGRICGRGRAGSKKHSEQLAADEALKLLRKEHSGSVESNTAES